MNMYSQCLFIFIFVKVIDGDYRGYRGRYIFENVSRSRSITQECANSLNMYIQNLNDSSGDDPWALRMLDASSKIPSGLLFSYNFGELGNFAQCLGTESKYEYIKGKYCLGTVYVGTSTASSRTVSNTEELEKQVKIRRATWAISMPANNTAIPNPTWALCLPSNCTVEDVFNITDVNDLIGLKFTSFVCQTKEDVNVPLTAGAIITITILSIIVMLMVSSTIYELRCIYKKTKPAHDLLIAFSVYTNSKKVLSTSKSGSEICCLNGIRCLSMVWVVAGHTFSVYTTGPLFNLKDVVDWVDSVQSMIIVNGTLSVDSFLVVGGALVVYVSSKINHQGHKLNIFKYYIHRYIRLTPALAAVVLVSATLLEYMGSGPNWNNIKYAFADPCKDHWWSTLLYIQNYVNVNRMCIGQTWYLNVDTQLYLISPILLLLLWKYKRVGEYLLIFSVLVFIAVPFYIAYSEELSGILTNFYPKASNDIFMNRYYLQTHGRAAPWFIGVLLGHTLFEAKFGNQKARKVNKGIISIVWIIWCFVMVTCLLGGHSTLRNVEYDRLGNSFYIALLRPVWGVCIAWLIWACEMGYAGPVNSFLSLSIFQVGNRFTYSIYLLHVTMLYSIVFSEKTSIYFSIFNMAYLFWGIYMISFVLSIPWVLAFESPIIVLERHLFKAKTKNNLNDT